MPSRLAAPSNLSRASSSSSQNPRPVSSSTAKPPNLVAETPGARAKREEAERERAMALASGESAYDEPALPRWEPRRPPPGRGPGSMDESMDAAKQLGSLVVEDANAPPGGGYEAQNRAPEDLPPSYS